MPHSTQPLPPSSSSEQTHTLPPAPEAPTPPPSTPGSEFAVVVPRADGVCVPGYEILSTLGRGGMGVVYQARQTKLGRIVALKMILSGVHADAADLAHFRTEAEAIARLQHPNIVQTYEVGEQGGLPYFSLEFCGSGSLEKKLAGTPLPLREATALVEPLARAMQAAYDMGVIHRDLKPANVLLAEAAKATVPTADALLDSLKRATDAQVPPLSGAFGAVAEWMAPRDVADLLTKHPLPPAAAEAILRDLEPLARRRFETIDDAVRWFRAADAETKKP